MCFASIGQNKFYYEYKDTKTKRIKHLAIIAALIPQLGLAQGLAPGGHFIFNWDFNDDGMVSADEFAAKSADWFATIDRDGMIISKDFGPQNN